MPNHPVTQANQMNSGMNPMDSGSVNPQQPGMPNVQPGIAPVNSVNQTINQSRPSTPGQQEGYLDYEIILAQNSNSG